MAIIFILKTITISLLLLSKIELGLLSLIFIIPIILLIVSKNKIKIKEKYFLLILISLTFLLFDSLYVSILPKHRQINSITGKVNQIKYKQDRIIIHIENNYVKAFTLGKYSKDKIEEGDIVRLDGNFKQIQIKDYYFYSENYTHKGYFKKISLIKKNNINKTFSNSDYSYIINGLILGKRAEIPDKIIEDFKSTSLMHLLAISGMHIGIIIGLIYIVIMFIPIAKRYKLILASVILIVYGLILGFIPSAVRAIIFSILIIMANIYNKKIRIIDALFATGFIIIFLRPQTIFSISFWLSFLATLGIICFLPVMQSINKKIKNKILSYTLNGLLVSIFAQLFIFPIVLYNFGRLNLISLFLSLPLSIIITLIIYWAIISLGFIWIKQINQIFINASDFAILVFLIILDISNRIEFLTIKINLSLTGFIISYVLVFLISYIVLKKLNREKITT